MKTQQMSLFGDESTPAMPSGFRYQPDLIDAEEEAALVRAIAQMQLTPYEFRGFLAHRKVTAFGFRYSYRSRRNRRCSAGRRAWTGSTAFRKCAAALLADFPHACPRLAFTYQATARAS